MENRLQAALDALGDKLHSVAETAHEVSRTDYTAALRDVEKEFDIQQGDPDYLEWVLTLIGRSPKIIEDTEEEANGTD